jgi:NAD(P)-dependent dehydrogenase (short-subunit alcohol dehydrogenase family)
MDPSGGRVIDVHRVVRPPLGPSDRDDEIHRPRYVECPTAGWPLHVTDEGAVTDAVHGLVGRVGRRDAIVTGAGIRGTFEAATDTPKRLPRN